MWPPGVTRCLTWLALVLMGRFVQLEGFSSKCYFPGKVSDGEHCRGYFTCVQGVRVKGSCQDNQVFIAKFGKCVRIPNTLCTPRPTAPDLRGTRCEKLNAKRPYFIDCERFLRCNNFTYDEVLCPPDRTYSHVLGTCVFTDDVCRTSDPEEKLSFMSETDEASPYLVECETQTNERFVGDKMDPYDCSLYFTCGVEDPDEDDIIHEDVGIIESKRCPDGQLFEAESKECKDSSIVDCGDRFRDTSLFGQNPKSGRMAGRFAGRVAAPVTPPHFRLQPGRYAVRFLRLEDDGSAEVIGRPRRKKHKKSKKHPGQGRSSVRRKHGRGLHMRRLHGVTKTTTSTTAVTTMMEEAVQNIPGLAGGGSNRALLGGEDEKYPALAMGNDEDEQPTTDDAGENDTVAQATLKPKAKNKRKTMANETTIQKPNMPRSMFSPDNLNQSFGLRRGKILKIPMILSQEPHYNAFPAGRALAPKHETDSTRPPCADAKPGNLASPATNTTDPKTVTIATTKPNRISSPTAPKALIKDPRNVRPLISTTTKMKSKLKQKPTVSGRAIELHPHSTAPPIHKTSSVAVDTSPKTAKTLQGVVTVSYQGPNPGRNISATKKGRFVVPLFPATPAKHTNSATRGTQAIIKGKNAFATSVPKTKPKPAQVAKMTTKSGRFVSLLTTAPPRNVASSINRQTFKVDSAADRASTTSTVKSPTILPSKPLSSHSAGVSVPSIQTPDRPEPSKKPAGNKVNIPAIAGRGIWTRLTNGAKNASGSNRTEPRNPEPPTALPQTTKHPLANIRAEAHQELGLKEHQKGKETITKYETNYHGRGAQKGQHEDHPAPVKVTVTHTEAEYAGSGEEEKPFGKPKNDRKNHGNDKERNDEQLELLAKVNVLLQRVDIAQGELMNIEKRQQQHDNLDQAGKLIDRLSKVEPMVQKLMTAADQISKAEENLGRLAKLQDDRRKHPTSDESDFKSRGRYVNIKSNEASQKTDQNTSSKLAQIEERLEQIARESMMSYPSRGRLIGLVSLGDHEYKTPLDEEQNLRLFQLEQQVKSLNISVEELLLDSESNYKSNRKGSYKDRTVHSDPKGRMAAPAFKTEKTPGHPSSKLSNDRSVMTSDSNESESKVMKSMHMPYGVIVTPKWPHQIVRYDTY